MSEIAVQAPARVNLIGEHTDHNGGFVLPTTTALLTRATAAPRADRTVVASSSQYEEEVRFELDGIEVCDEVTWISYIKGVIAELQAAGIDSPGMNIHIDSNIPIGGGLSSSAALELAVAKTVLIAAGASLPGDELAKICRRAECRYAQVQCGIMDQYAIACAQKGHAIALDCRSLDAEQILIPPEARFVLIDSGVRHKLPDSNYNDRAGECEQAARLLGIESLRDLDMETLGARKQDLGDVLFKRCRHVVTENKRVLAAARALAESDLGELGRLLDQSHNSLRDDFETSCDEIETLIRVTSDCPEILGSRMVGGGFGGCVLALTTADDLDHVISHLAGECALALGDTPWMHVVEASDPASEVSRH
jgi:galactokinase